MKEESNIETPSPVKRFWLLLKPHRKELTQIYTLAVFNGLVALSLPLGIQAIINFIQAGQMSTSWLVLVTFVLAGIGIAGILQIMQLRITENLQQSIFARAAFEFAFRFPKMKLEQFSKAYAPELTNRFFETLAIQKGLSKILIGISTAILQIVIGLAVLSLYHPFFIILSGVLILLLIVIFRITGEKGLRSSLKESKFKYKVAHWLQEIARANKSFKLASDSDLALERTDDYVKGYTEAREQHFKVLQNQYMYLIFFKIIVAGLLLSIGGILVLNQQMNVGQFVAAELIILMVLGSVEKLIVNLEVIYDVLTALEKLGQITDMELDSFEGNTDLIQFSGNMAHLELKDVNFSYQKNDKKDLDNISFTISPKEHVMITGFNNSGKSTLLKIIAGLYQIDAGHISINQLPLQNYSLSTLRARMGFCMEEDTIFHGTLTENISMGRSNISTKEILKAIEIVQLKNQIQQLQQGLETIIYPEGKSFSKSTIQKIILARAIVHQPMLLLIDDSLDMIEVSDRIKIIDEITKSEHPWTMIAASNDEHLKAKSDKIIVLENHKIKSIHTK